jgi:hypothetical protein
MPSAGIGLDLSFLVRSIAAEMTVRAAHSDHFCR